MENLSEENLRFLLRNQSNSDCKLEIESLIQFMSDREMTEELKKLLRLAVQENNQLIVSKLLQYADRETLSLLLLIGAAGSTNEEILMMLIRAGTKQYKNQMNLCHLYGLTNNVHMIRRVREEYPDRFEEYLNCVDIDGCTPLICAVQNSSEGAIRFFLENGADIHIADKEQQSAFWFACSIGNKNIVRLLVEYGADVNQCSISGKSPLYMAFVKRAQDVAEFILENGGLCQGPNIPLMKDIDMTIFKDESLRYWMENSFRSIEDQADPPAKIWSDIASVVLDPLKDNGEKLSFISNYISKYRDPLHSGFSWNATLRSIASIAVHGIPKPTV
jgi:hypothetical protein